jgi:DNA-directed RNA polymerase subunit RPC12/RpoP
MSEQSPEVSIRCSQCGGELHPDEGEVFLTCPYCNSTVYLDKSQVVFHWYLAPTIKDEEAAASLARWMAGNQTVKDLDKKSKIVSQSFEYFPLWYFKQHRPSGEERILVEPAAGISISEIKHLKLVAGDLRKYKTNLNEKARQPNVPLQTALKWLADRGVSQEEVSERALVHVPFYTIKYSYQGTLYTAMVEGGTGGVYANLFPAKEEAPYRMAAVLSGGVFLCLATFPVIGALISGEQGLAIGLGACFGLGALVSLGLFALGAWVAAKV